MRRCLGCMREYSEEFDLCPHCGYIFGSGAESGNQLPPGTLLRERYLLGKVLGQGGFGITYIAWDQKEEYPVAIKEYMPTGLASRITGEQKVSCYNKNAQQHFANGLVKLERECLTIARFRDLESVVRVYDFLQANDTAYIVMELLRGQNVRDLLQTEGKLSFERAMQIMEPILLTLQAMHDAGIIHRDVAPDNIFVCEDGQTKLLDFGAARIVDDGTNEKTRSVILKHGYAPREQFSAHAPQGPYTDVYSSAATLYKLLTGETPADSIERTENADDLPALKALRVPEAVKDAIRRAMRLDSAERTQSAKAFLSQLTVWSGRDKKAAPHRKQTPEKEKQTSIRNKSKKVFATLAPVLSVVVIVCAVIIAVHFAHGNVSEVDFQQETHAAEPSAVSTTEETTAVSTTEKTTAASTTKPIKASTTSKPTTTEEAIDEILSPLPFFNVFGGNDTPEESSSRAETRETVSIYSEPKANDPDRENNTGRGILPNVVDADYAEAINILYSCGFTNISRTKVITDDPSKNGIVFEQTPAPRPLTPYAYNTEIILGVYTNERE